jgi:hypothetical protein
MFRPTIPLRVDLNPLVVKLWRCESSMQAIECLQDFFRASCPKIAHENRRAMDQRETPFIEVVTITANQNPTQPQRVG